MKRFNKRRNKTNKTLLSAMGAERRRLEIEQYGKLLSLRPCICMKNKKKYNRKEFKYDFD